MGEAIKIFVCKGKSCKKKDGAKLVPVCEKICHKLGIKASVHTVSCLDECKKAPVVLVKPDKLRITKADKERLKKKLKKNYSSLASPAI